MPDGQLTFLGHATFRLTLPDERVILIDPWLSGNPSCPADQKEQRRCDCVVITHGHDDHTQDVPTLIAEHGPTVVAMYDLTTALGKYYPDGKYQGMNIGGTLEIDGIQLSMTRAYHSSSITLPDGQSYAGTPAGIVIRVKGLGTIYHAGDTDVFSDMQLIQQMYSPAIVMLPIGDLFTMGPAGAAMAAKYFDAQSIVPMHYGTFPILTGSVGQFKEALGRPLSDRVMALEPGQTAIWGQHGLS